MPPVLSSHALPALGTPRKEIDTPALCLDLDVMESNIRAVAEQCRQRNVAWRPHAKGHKVPAIARLELDAGAIGVTCAKLGEAEVMAEAGIEDILIANIIVGPQKVRRLVELRRMADPIVCVDHIDQAEPIALAMAEAGLEVRMLIEVDIGLCRVGVLPGQPTLELARRIADRPGVQFAGIMGYEGHLLALDDQQEKTTRIREALGWLIDTRDLLAASGIECGIVSCAGTGSYRHSIEHPGITEVQAGGAIFMDVFYREKCRVPELEFALTIPTTIVSRPTPDRAIIDAGRKTLNMEVCLPRVLSRDDVYVEKLSAEHGWLKLDPSAQGIRIGERIDLVPGYADMTTVLHDAFFGFRAGRLECIWPLEARGRLT